MPEDSVQPFIMCIKPNKPQELLVSDINLLCWTAEMPKISKPRTIQNLCRQLNKLLNRKCLVPLLVMASKTTVRILPIQT